MIIPEIIRKALLRRVRKIMKDRDHNWQTSKLTLNRKIWTLRLGVSVIYLVADDLQAIRNERSCLRVVLCGGFTEYAKGSITHERNQGEMNWIRKGTTTRLDLHEEIKTVLEERQPRASWIHGSKMVRKTVSVPVPAIFLTVSF